MIYGIGTDLCDVRRITATLARKGDRFAEKVLGPDEIKVCDWSSDVCSSDLADRIELYTETYASAHGTPRQADVLARFARTDRKSVV